MKLLLPLLLTPLASLQRTRLVAASPALAPEPTPSPHDAATEPDWRHAYLRLREEQVELPAPQVSRPDRQHARPRLRQEPDESDHFEPLPPMPMMLATVPVLPEAAPVQATPLTPTAERIVAAVRQITVAVPSLQPAARVWQVELPTSGPAWQLRVEQAQPQAPLNLELRVPAVLQSQARQQLGDLDKRLREAGHEVLRSRLRNGKKKRGPVDGVPS